MELIKTSLDEIPDSNPPSKTNAKIAGDRYKYDKLRAQRSHLIQKRSFGNLTAEENAQLQILNEILNK